MKDYLLAASGVATIVSGYFLRAAFFWGAELLRSAGRQESVLDQQLAMMDEDEEE